MFQVLRFFGAAAAVSFVVLIIVTAIAVTLTGCVSHRGRQLGCFQMHVEHPRYEEPETLLHRFWLQRVSV